MNTPEFMELFIKELNENSDLRHYHRIINNPSSYEFRRAYYQQRMQFLENQLTKPSASIIDVGCGYGTTSIFLAINGHYVLGTTLEYYYDKIMKRLEFWSKHADLSKLSFKYENLFDSNYEANTFDYVVAQDTLHHLEPINEALAILNRALKADGKMIICEENGNNIFNSAKNFKQRGFKRIIEYHDEKLGKTILFGNENTRSYAKWKNLFESSGMKILDSDTEYIRFYMPGAYQKQTADQLYKKEQALWRKNSFLKEYFFFGINFCAVKSIES